MPYILCLYFLITIFCQQGLAEKVAFIPKTYLLLPQNSLVKIKWILPPNPGNSLDPSPQRDLSFFLNHKEEPVILYEQKLLFNFSTGHVLLLKNPVKDMVYLDNGVLLFADGNILGSLEVKRENHPIPSATLKPICELPLPNSRIYKGDLTLYAVGFNKNTSKYEVYLFIPTKQLFQKILSLEERIDGITGKEGHLFLLRGRTISEYKKGDLIKLYEHPREEIKEILYNERTGLLYKTSKGVGLVKKGSALEFLQTEDPILFLKGSYLYVFFKTAQGILELSNLDDLMNYSFQVDKIVDLRPIIQEVNP